MDTKTYIYCNIKNEDDTASCYKCKNSFVTDLWADLKCKYPNHYVNEVQDGYVCNDYIPGKQIITENAEGGVVDDIA